MSGGDLRDWARGNVPAGPRHAADGRVGRTLTESLSDVLSPPTLPSGLQRRAAPLAVAGGLVAGTLGALALVVPLALLVVWATWPDPAPPAAPREVRVTAPPEPVPVPVRVPPPPTPEVRTPQPPPTVAPATGRVEVSGDALSIALVDGAGTLRAPGDLPPGTYGVLADFGQGQVPAGTVTVEAHGAVALRCVAAFQRCAPQ
jgi:hypothetical protein